MASHGRRSSADRWTRFGSIPARCATWPANIAISSPRQKNDRLVYLTAAEVTEYLDEIEAGGLTTSLIGFTGGEPFMNPELPGMLEDVLSRGFRALVLTNAMKPMAKCKPALLKLRERFGDRLTIRVLIDHYGPQVHEVERGERSWRPTIDGLLWLSRAGFSPHVASRRLSGEPEAAIRSGFAALFAELGVAIDAADPAALAVFLKWMPPPMFRRSPKRAGAFSGNRRRASCA
jgi:MoaA/NifB/PqqE/SkfB family radical SAM enzyme